MKEKMNFEEFKTAVLEGIKEFLPERFVEAEINLQNVMKNNGVELTGIVIKLPTCNTAPTIYLEQFFSLYESGKELNDVLRELAELRIQKDTLTNIDTELLTNFEKCKGRIKPRLIGTEMNQRILQERPHVLIEDLAVLFHIDFGRNEEGFMTVPVSNSLMNNWNISIDELYKLAVENMINENAVIFGSMGKIIMEMMLPDMMKKMDCDRDTAEMIFEALDSSDVKMYIVTNKNKYFGASVILDTQFMNRVVDSIGDNFFVIPSSIHELILIPDDENISVSELENMIAEVNATQLEAEDILSNHPYRYSLETGFVRA